MPETKTITVFQHDLDHHPHNLGQLQTMLDDGWDVSGFGPIEGTGIPFLNKKLGHMTVTLEKTDKKAKRVAVNVQSSLGASDTDNCLTEETLKTRYLDKGWTVICEGPESSMWVLLHITRKIVIVQEKVNS